MIVQTAPQTSIDRDLRCDGCEYNLRGLTIDSRCPECGLPIERTIAAAGEFVTSDRLRLVRLMIVLLLIECVTAAGAGAYAFGRPWKLEFVATKLTTAAWVGAISVFILIAWMHRERQSIQLRWNWISRYIGLIVCGIAVAATCTRIAFSSRRLAALQVVSLLPIALNIVPAFSVWATFRRCKWKLLAWSHVLIALLSLLIAAYLAYELFGEVWDLQDWRAFAVAPIAGVDYATILPIFARLLWYQERMPVPGLPSAFVVTRLIWLFVMLFTATRITRELRRRRTREGADGRIASSSRP